MKTQVDGQAVHGQGHEHQDEAGCGGIDLELRLGTRRPVEHLDRHHREGGEDPVEQPRRRVAGERCGGQECDEGQRADGDDRRRFADGARHADDHAGEDAGRRIRQDVVAHRLPCGCAAGIGSFVDGLRDGADGFARGDDDHRQDQQRQRQPGREDALAETEVIDEEAECQQAIDDGRDAGQIADVDLYDVGHPVLRRVLLQVDACGNAKGHGRERGYQHHEDGTDPGREDAGILRAARRKRGEELAGEARYALDRHIDEQYREGQHTHHQRQDADNGEEQVPALGARDDGANGGKVGGLQHLSTPRGNVCAASSRAG